MRILLTTFTYPPEANGVAEVVRAQVAGFLARGHHVTIATGFDPSRTPSPPDANPQVQQFRIQQGALPSQYSGPDVDHYQQFLREFQADVIISHCWQIWSTNLAIEALRGHPAKKVMVSHGFVAHRWRPNPRFPWGIGEWLRSQPYVWRLPGMFRTFDRIVFLSSRADWNRFFDLRVLKWLAHPAWTAIPNGSDPGLNNPGLPDFRAALGLDRDQFLVICVGAYDQRKNQLAALRSFCKAALPNSVLLLIGNEFNHYSQQVEKFYSHWQSPARPNVILLEKQARDSIRAAYQAADCVVLSSRSETQPLVLLDSMAVGKPFITTDVGCVRDFAGGLVVNSEGEMTAALQRLHADPGLRAQLGRAGLAAAQSTYNWGAVSEAYEQLIANLVEKPK